MIKKIFLTIISLMLVQGFASANTIKFAQITDSHFVANDQYRTETLQNAVKNINNEKDISFVIFTGDNIDAPKEAFLPEFVKTINKLKYDRFTERQGTQQAGLLQPHFGRIAKSAPFRVIVAETKRFCFLLRGPRFSRSS